MDRKGGGGGGHDKRARNTTTSQDRRWIANVHVTEEFAE
jgi:hypothetical protein